MVAIHAPVPGFEAELAVRVMRIFDHLKTEQPVWLTNWSLMTEATLFLPTSHERSPACLEGLDAASAGERLFLRAERQTLRRLPKTGAILFTIRTHVDPLNAIAGHAPLITALGRTVRAMPAGMAGYKAIAPVQGALLGWLAAQ